MINDKHHFHKSNCIVENTLLLALEGVVCIRKRCGQESEVYFPRVLGVVLLLEIVFYTPCKNSGGLLVRALDRRLGGTHSNSGQNTYYPLLCVLNTNNI